MLYERLLRPALFALDPEATHEWTLALLARTGPLLRLLRPRLRWVDHPALARTVWGLRFPNPVGLAAGFDKQGTCLDAWEGLGFGFVEVGTVTAVPQPGNPRPRLFRLPADRAMVNRLGFNSDGAAAVAARLAAARCAIPVGVNIGKGRATPLETAAADYEASFDRLAPHADYVAVNVSSPNTPGLRDLQAAERLGTLVARLVARSHALGPGRGGGPRPILVKLSPDLDDAGLEAAVGAAVDAGAAGVIATNTTTSRTGLHRPLAESGGLSGRPLAARSRAVVAAVHRLTGGRLPIIGVGGLFTADDVLAMQDAGAALVQLYTGFVYGGPFTIRLICRDLAGRRGHAAERAWT